jgi:hypothetical protein
MSRRESAERSLGLFVRLLHEAMESLGMGFKYLQIFEGRVTLGNNFVYTNVAKKNCRL